MSNPIQHVFVLMLENRSYDHMLGFSNLAGIDAVTGELTMANGLTGNEQNFVGTTRYTVKEGAPFAMPFDPGHEFEDVVHQLCGPAATFPNGGPYPAIDMSGFAASCAATGGSQDPGVVMQAYSPSQLPVLNALAAEFVVCDNWHASLPGPTWPNRLFVHAASAAGLDHSPSTQEIVCWETGTGIEFPNGTIFDRLQNKGVTRRLYAGDEFPLTAALKDIGLDDFRPYYHFAADLAQPGYPYSYVFIEPSYNVLADYQCSTSQHPLGDVTRGEALIKSLYESVRRSPVWKDSLIIVTWDEHGGFSDHVIPPQAVPPGDTVPGQGENVHGFHFDLYGPRVPAIVISPRIQKNRIDHRLYDHSSIPATVEALFGLSPMTNRDAAANQLLPLVTLDEARIDTPETLPDPAVSGVPGCPPVSLFDPVATLSAELAPLAGKTALLRPNDPIGVGNLAGVLHTALQRELIALPGERERIVQQFAAVKTRKQAEDFLAGVQARVRAARV
jgi:phospholipase C